VAPTVSVQRLRRVELPTGGLVRVVPREPLTVVDGAAGGLAGLAGYGALDPGKAYAYAPDLGGAAAVRTAARDGAAFVISDTNRRRAFVAARLKGATGPTLPAAEGVSVDGTILDPFGDLDQRVQTVAEHGGGIRAVTAPASPQVTQFPDQRPFAALDGDPATAWVADRALVPARHTLTVDFREPRAVDVVRLLPYSDSRGVVQAVTVNGRRFAVRRGWNTLRVGLGRVSSVSVHLASVTKPVEAHAGAGGIRELVIDDIDATETLRPPSYVEDALHGTDLSHNALTYILDRTTADVPEVQQKVIGERGAGEARDAQDPERALRRVIAPPAARSYAVDGWGSISAGAPDAVFAGLDGDRRDAAFASSSRLEGMGRYRASGAFDGGGARSWAGQWVPGHAAWLSWAVARPRTVRALTLDPPTVRVRRPTRVRLTVDAVAGRTVPVGAGGRVALPWPVRGRRFRLDILDARWPAATPGRIRQRRAVGIGEVRGAGVAPFSPPRTGTVSLPCGIATVDADGTRYALRAITDRASLDAGRPLRLSGCGRLAILAGDATLIGSTGTEPVAASVRDASAGLPLDTGPAMRPVYGTNEPPPPPRGESATPSLRVDGLRLTSAAPSPIAHAAVLGGGRVVDAGQADHGGRTGVKVEVRGPSYLVLGQSFDKGWRATCDGRDLGAPRVRQGYANAWPVEPGCANVSIAYRPQRLADAGYAISAAGCAALLALLGIGAWRRRRNGSVTSSPLPSRAWPRDEPVPLPEPPSAAPLPARRAIAIAIVGALVIGGMFGLRAGAVAAPLLAILLWRGVADRTLGLAILGLLGVVVPAIYAGVALFSDEKILGGNGTRFGGDRLGAHWVAVAALVLLVVLLWRTLAAARPRDGLPSRR
jgi:hypothetical protein